MTNDVKQLEALFGKNFCQVFSGTRKITKAKPDEYTKILATIKKGKKLDPNGRLVDVEDKQGNPVIDGKIDTSDWDVTTATRSADAILFVLEQYVWLEDGPGYKKGTPLFLNFALPTYDVAKEPKGYGEEGKVMITNVFINYKVQRTLNYYNIVKYLLRFDTGLCFGAKGRYSKHEDRYFANDGQHCIMLAILTGAPHVNIIYVEDEDTSTDVDQFLSFSVDAYGTEDYDKMRSQKTRASLMLEEDNNRNEPYKEDQIPLGLFDMLETVKCKFIPKAKTPGMGECKAIKKMQGHMETFVGFKETWQRYYYNSDNPDIMGLALKLERAAYRNKPLDQAPIWGLCVLLKAQGKMSKKDIDTLFDVLPIALKHRWPGGPTDIWESVNAMITKQFPNKGKTKDDWRNKEGARGPLIATAIKDIVDAYVEMQKRSNAKQGARVVKDPKLKPVLRDGEEVKFNTPFPNTFSSRFSSVA